MRYGEVHTQSPARGVGFPSPAWLSQRHVGTSASPRPCHAREAGDVGAGQCPGTGLLGGSSLLKELFCHLSSPENDTFTAALCNDSMSSQADQRAGPWHWPSPGRAEHPPQALWYGAMPRSPQCVIAPSSLIIQNSVQRN